MKQNYFGANGEFEKEMEYMALNPEQYAIRRKLCSTRRPKVLIADDDAEISSILILISRKYNFEITVVNNGLAAFEQIKNNKFDLIFLDNYMPKMNGEDIIKKISLLKSIENKDKNITPVVIYSSCEYIINSFDENGFYFIDIWKKPMKIETLQYKISTILTRLGI